jgi:hypothetical protein
LPKVNPCSCSISTGSTAPVAAMTWIADGAGRLQGDVELFVRFTPVTRCVVAPWLVADSTLRAFAAQRGRATPGGEVTAVVVGVLVDGTVRE